MPFCNMHLSWRPIQLTSFSSIVYEKFWPFPLHLTYSPSTPWACLGGFVDTAFVRPCLQNIICTSFPCGAGNSILQKIMFIFLVKEMETRNRIIWHFKKKCNWTQLEIFWIFDICKLGKEMQASVKLERNYCMGKDLTLLNLKDEETEISLSPDPGSCGCHVFGWSPGGIFCKRYINPVGAALQSSSWDACFLTGYPLRKRVSRLHSWVL